MTSPNSKLELVVRPTAAVAHAAAHFSAHPSERLRFREHFDPCCFQIDLYDDSKSLPIRRYLVIAWRDRDGARIEVVRDRGGELVVVCLLALTLSAVTAPLFGALSLLLLPVHAASVAYVLEVTNPDHRTHLAEVRAAVERMFAPLRRCVALPYREPAALPAP